MNILILTKFRTNDRYFVEKNDKQPMSSEWWSSLDSGRDGCRVSVHREGCSLGSSLALAASLARRLLCLAPHVARFCDQLVVSFLMQVQA